MQVIRNRANPPANQAYKQGKSLLKRSLVFGSEPRNPYISYLHLFVGTSEEISRGDRWVIEAFSQLE
ncbi:MAG: hypothetical protein V7L22_21590 [Nostoc sp.]|uniref:hypothetical protein n=1 Tax=Nostoc sp. TaxID=1180 RepID=UPI002FF49F5C